MAKGKKNNVSNEVPVIPHGAELVQSAEQLAKKNKNDKPTEEKKK